MAATVKVQYPGGRVREISANGLDGFLAQGFVVVNEDGSDASSESGEKKTAAKKPSSRKRRSTKTTDADPGEKKEQ